MPNHGKESYAKVSSNSKEKKSILPGRVHNLKLLGALTSRAKVPPF